MQRSHRRFGVADPAAGLALRLVPVLVLGTGDLYVSLACPLVLDTQASWWGLQTLTTHPPPAVYIFVGTILFHDHVLRYVLGSIIGAVGVAYSALEFVPSVEPPASMREADAGWGAEQV